MSYTMSHKRMKPILDRRKACLSQRAKLDIATNPAPEALFEAGSGGFQIWATPDDHPKGWDGVPMDMGTFAKPCAFVASVWWGWEGESLTHLCLKTDAYDLRAVKQRPSKIHNRPEDIAWAKQKIRTLFQQAGVPCPPIKVEKG